MEKGLVKVEKTVLLDRMIQKAPEVKVHRRHPRRPVKVESPMIWFLRKMVASDLNMRKVVDQLQGGLRDLCSTPGVENEAQRNLIKSKLEMIRANMERGQMLIRQIEQSL